MQTKGFILHTPCTYKATRLILCLSLVCFFSLNCQIQNFIFQRGMKQKYFALECTHRHTHTHTVVWANRWSWQRRTVLLLWTQSAQQGQQWKPCVFACMLACVCVCVRYATGLYVECVDGLEDLAKHFPGLPCSAIKQSSHYEHLSTTHSCMW